MRGKKGKFVGREAQELFSADREEQKETKDGDEDEGKRKMIKEQERGARFKGRWGPRQQWLTVT